MASIGTRSSQATRTAMKRSPISSPLVLPNRVMVGDCVDIMNGLPAGVVDMVFADPP